jgi:hypothetical protein
LSATDTDWRSVCNPCRDQHHLECEGTEEKPCLCLVCDGERIGDAVIGQPGEAQRW